jgi:hypothetical protein
VRRIAISGLVALAAVLGGVAVPATAIAQPTGAMAQPTSAVRAGSVVTTRTARTAPAAEVGEGGSGEPLISCVLTTDCLGLEGSSSLSDAGTSIPTRAARWNGSSWQGVGVTLPKGTKSDDLNGVSCKAANFCLVVGDYYTSTSQNATNRVLALSYNGTSLRPTATVPLPKGTTDAALTSVSCASPRYCVAIGMADGDTAAFGEAGSLNLIETWNGAKWALLHTAAGSIGSATQVAPTAVSCATAAFCVLAGQASTFTATSATTGIYVASWNGKKLTTMKSAKVGGSKDFLVPAGVSCATASNCAVTGAFVDASSSAPKFTAFTEIWNGKAWQLARVTWPKGAVDSFTMGVSCYAAHSCEAVGIDGSNAETSFDAAAVSFNAAAGTVQAVPGPAKGNVQLFAAVSCLPWGSCVAVGQTGKATAKSAAPTTGVWNGKAWKLEPGL